ncbi:hypothetical protein [Kitasatospora aureofaciens]|uniref:hypothetical protein n=1 Tax=Kitasatospora aureofaciens TaxID=1894 RepID=UPI001C46EAAA|nr:hypothetical protein [Kitasatospora aureofaciens]MBV6697945.1 hypothetical protein [Kitasatospora aureofaciens]
MSLAVSGLVAGSAGAWQLFHQDAPCEGEEPGWPASALGAIGLGVVGTVAVALSWSAERWGSSRAAEVAVWALAAVAMLCAIGMVLLGRSSYCG